MARVEASISLPLALEATWTAAVDWPGQKSWVPASSVSLLEGTGLGARIEARTGWGPLVIRDPMEVTAWDPPHRAELSHTGPLVRGRATYEMASVDGGLTRFTWIEDLDAPQLLLRPILSIATPLFAQLMAVALRRFARWAPTRGSSQ